LGGKDETGAFIFWLTNTKKERMEMVEKGEERRRGKREGRNEILLLSTFKK